jgi:hypothetical protein
MQSSSPTIEILPAVTLTPPDVYLRVAFGALFIQRTLRGPFRFNLLFALEPQS